MATKYIKPTKPGGRDIPMSIVPTKNTRLTQKVNGAGVVTGVGVEYASDPVGAISERAIQALYIELQSLEMVVGSLIDRLAPYRNEFFDEGGPDAPLTKEEVWPPYFTRIRTLTDGVRGVREKVQLVSKQLAVD